jgi:hypothetical protein
MSGADRRDPAAFPVGRLELEDKCKTLRLIRKLSSDYAHSASTLHRPVYSLFQPVPLVTNREQALIAEPLLQKFNTDPHLCRLIQP